MSRALLIARARTAAETGMVDTCTIRRSTGETTDPNSGVITPTWQDTYTGKCRVQQRDVQAQQHDVGEDYVLLQRVQVQLPVSVVGIQVDDEVTITASRDPELVGRVFLVRDLAYKTDASSRRITVTERTS